jgi:hypothetical protein
MGAFADFINQHKITADALVKASAKAEEASEKDLELLSKRAEKRAKQADVTYDKAGLAKPKSGRGVSALLVGKALEGKALPKRVRGKLVRAVNAVLGGKGEAATTAKLFAKEGVKYGKKPKAKKKKK